MLDIVEFRRLARQGAAPADGVTALSARSLGPVADAERVIRFCFSDGTVDRGGDTIDPQGWNLSGYQRNPVVLWAHDALAPPIGRTRNLFIDHRGLIGDVEFAPPEVYDFADTIFRLVRSGYIKAGSVGFLPIEFSLSKDKGREFGIDFRRQELLEFSICPVPANPNALAEASAKGVITSRAAIAARPRFAGNAVVGDGDDPERLRQRRLAKLLGDRSTGGRLPPRGILRERFAGTLADRDAQVDRAFPGLAAQELEDARAAREARDCAETRLAVVAAITRAQRN